MDKSHTPKRSVQLAPAVTRLDPTYHVYHGHGKSKTPRVPLGSARSHGDEATDSYFEHSTAKRINTDSVFASALRKQYPELDLIVVEEYQCNLLAFAGAGHATFHPIHDKGEVPSSLEMTVYLPPARRMNGNKGQLFFAGDLTGNSTGGSTDDTSKWNPQQDIALSGIGCSDSSLRVEDVDDFFSVYQAQYAESSFADVIAYSRVPCANWKFSAAEQIDLNKLRNVNTSYPILVVNGRYDPVTSLRSAWEVSTDFRGSRVVVHEGAGHSFTNHPSNCTQEVVKKYFVDGVMPKLNTTCSPDMTAFEYAASLRKGSDEED